MNKRIFFTAGPSHLYKTVPEHIQTALEDDIGSISHRGPKFEQILRETQTGLKELLRIPQEYHVLFFASANEIWERLVQNCIETSSFHFVNGSFGERFYWVAQKLGKNPTKIEVPQGEFFNLEEIAVPLEAELIGITHNESSSGVLFPAEMIHALADSFPDKLIAVDAVSSLPYPTFNYEKLDAVYFSVQKGFGLPAGLGVLILSPRAYDKSLLLEKKGLNVGSYHSFSVMKLFDDKGQTAETPNVMNIYVLNKVIKDYLEYGIEKIRKETEEKAKMMYDYFDKHDRYNPAVENKGMRSPTLIVINTKGNSQKIYTYLDTLNMEVGFGYGDAKEQQIRIANFPSHTKQDIERLLHAFNSL